MHRNTCPHAPQRGIATVLILLLVGLSLSVAALGTAHYIRSQQKQDIATHAQTQAQMKAWTGAELVRQYLQKLQADNQLSAFYASGPSPLTLEGEGVKDVILAEIEAIDATAGTVTARITGITAPNYLQKRTRFLRWFTLCQLHLRSPVLQCLLTGATCG